MTYSLYSYSGDLIKNFRSLPRALHERSRHQGSVLKRSDGKIYECSHETNLVGTWK